MLQVAIDSATPVEPFLGYGGPMRAYGSAYGECMEAWTSMM